MQNGYRYFGVLAIENYGSGNSFSLPGKSASAGGFYNANTAYNPPQSFSIIWPQPVLTIRMLKDPIPGVTLDAEIIRNRGFRPTNHTVVAEGAGLGFDWLAISGRTTPPALVR
jgi:hypothetical protein